ncbi:MAG: radical SAM protein [Candidatus Muirbacterium halophilum]|nr:radical SAM protein [Candidatus Muirbacterium halophilum]
MKSNQLKIKKSGIINNIDLFLFLLKKTIPYLTIYKIINLFKLFISKIFYIKLNTKPYFILTDTINTCNLDCKMCFTKQIHFKEKIVYSYDIEFFEDFLKKNNKTLIFIMFGCLWEPSLNKDIYKMLELCNKYKVLAFLTTNLVNCDINKLVKTQTPYIQVSISAGDKEIYKKIHGKDYFIKVQKNLADLAYIINNQKLSIYIHVKSVLQKDNENLKTIKKLRLFLKKIKINKFSLKKFQSVRNLNDNLEILPKNTNFFDKTNGIDKFSIHKKTRNYSMKYVGPDKKTSKNEALYLIESSE